MSETAENGSAALAPEPPAVPTEQVPPPVDPLPELAPLSEERLPPTFRKHVDPKAPVPLRGMAAKGLVPLGPSDMCHCLAMLANDADAGVAANARKTAATLPDKILSVGLRDEDLSPRVLHFFAEMLEGKDQPLEYVVLNNAAHDRTVALIVAKTTSARIIDIVAGNQLRLLRDESVLRSLLSNPAASKSVVDTTCDFAVRSGVMLDDVPAMAEAYVRIHGAPPSPKVAAEKQELSAEAVIAEFGLQQTEAPAEAAPAPEGEPPVEEEKLNLTQRVAKMSVSEKIKLATLGNKEARTILMRDSNKLVAIAVANSPRITDGEILVMANSKTCQDDVLRMIYQSREWTRQYSIRMALVRHPKVPLAVAMRFMSTLREADIRELAKDKNIPSGLRAQAKKLTDKKKT